MVGERKRERELVDVDASVDLDLNQESQHAIRQPRARGSFS